MKYQYRIIAVMLAVYILQSIVHTSQVKVSKYRLIIF